MQMQMQNEEIKIKNGTDTSNNGNTVLAEVPDHGMYKERNCKDKATFDNWKWKLI